MESKKCRVCGREKVLTDFYYRKDSRTYKTECKECWSKRSKKYALENGDKLKEYREENKENITRYKRDHYKKNREKIGKRRKEYCKENKDKIKSQRKIYLGKNKEKIAKQQKEYAKKNKKRLEEKRKIYNSKPEVIERARGYSKKYIDKKRQDPIYRLGENISKGIRNHLNFNGISKGNRHWENIVGYSIQDFKKHIENLFTEGMRWERFSEIHIDHVIPKAFFKFASTDDVEFKMCWRLENLQPLWATDNIIKSDKIVWGGK